MPSLYPRIYLETTIFNRYFEEGREFCSETKQLFNEIGNGVVYGYASVAVLEELEQAPEKKRIQMLDITKKYGITILNIEQDVYDLADLYIQANIIPMKYRMDGVHIATASYNLLDCIISLNFKHINNIVTKIAIDIINKANNFRTPLICTPMEVIYNERYN
jgi:hypothetical protein